MGKVVLNLSTLSSRKIEKAVKLLPMEYRDQNIPIYLFQNLWIYYIYTYFFFTSKCVATDVKNSRAFFLYKGNDKDDPICVVMFNIGYIVESVISLYHEFRHVYQHKLRYIRKHQRSYYIMKDNDGCDKAEFYNSQFIEKDANIFASHFARSHRDTIKKIFNIDFTEFRINSKTGRYSIRKYKETTISYKFGTCIRNIKKIITWIKVKKFVFVFRTKLFFSKFNVL